MGLQRVGHNWATELNWTEWMYVLFQFSSVAPSCLTLTPKSTAHQVSLTFSNSRSLLKLMYICTLISVKFSSVTQLCPTHMLTNNLCNIFNHIDEISVEVQQVWTGNHQAYCKCLSFFSWCSLNLEDLTENNSSFNSLLWVVYMISSKSLHKAQMPERIFLMNKT